MGDKENSGSENITRAEAKATTAQQPADLLANFKSVAAASAAQLVGVLKEQGSMAGVRADKEVLYATIEDFARVDPNARRVVVIGCTGSGKSTMLNTMAGWKFVQRAPDYKYTWERGDADGTPLFEARASSDSVTKKTTYANLEWFGDASRPFVAVDTPGHDDPAGSEIDSPEAREVLGELAADLHNKLKALRHVHAIVVLHNDILSNRLNPATCAARNSRRAILAPQFCAIVLRHPPPPQVHDPQDGVGEVCEGGDLGVEERRRRLLEVQRARDVVALGARVEEGEDAGERAIMAQFYATPRAIP